MKILVTGGLGYIGSHICHLLKDRAVIIDNLSNSSLEIKRKLPRSTFYKGNINKHNQLLW